MSSSARLAAGTVILKVPETSLLSAFALLRICTVHLWSLLPANLSTSCSLARCSSRRTLVPFLLVATVPSGWIRISVKGAITLPVVGDCQLASTRILPALKTGNCRVNSLLASAERAKRISNVRDRAITEVDRPSTTTSEAGMILVSLRTVFS